MREVRLGPSEVIVERRGDGTITMRSTVRLGAYPDRLTERLEYWAARAPDRTFVAERDNGGWRRVTYAETLSIVRNLGQALLDRGLSAERPLAILSGNDIEHALLGLAALHVGVLYAPISPAYSLISQDHAKLRYIFELLTPGLVFAARGGEYQAALAAAMPPDAELVVTREAPGRAATLFSALAATPATPEVDAAHAKVGPDTVAKLLFTSGSTGLPKGVINTQRMLCSNQEMLRTVLAFLQDEPPVIVDWLPWNHTFGGNHNVGLVLYNGGSLYIDDGKPVPGAIEKTVRNLREIAPTVYFNVPKGWEALVSHFRREPALRETFFSRVKLLFYAGAGLAEFVWDDLDEIARETCGESILMLTGLGATESAPFAICCTKEMSRSGAVGLPVPGVELKLAPAGAKLEARLRGPSITPGYWRQDDLTAKAFDEEGFYCLGDAVRFADPDDPQKGLIFDGRITEDFKLSTGTWVSVGPLRARFIAHCAPYVADVVIAGRDRDHPCALVLADLDACRELHPDLREFSANDVLRHPAVRSKFGALLSALAEESTGSASRVVSAILLEEPPSIDAHEMTDKGSINQGAVLDNRAALVEELYATPPTPRVITISERS
jgi:feruloyl-CoA synthase